MAWEITGNLGTNPVNDFLGTQDNAALAIRTNDVEHIRVDTSGNVGIGTSAPVSPLDVRSASRIASLYTTTNATSGSR